MSVVVPARDEAQALPHLLGPLLVQLRPGDEIVVVDDASSDATADVATRSGARVVDAGVLPEGWVGKAHACAVGADATRAAVLVFLDADVRPPPDLLDRLAAAVEARSDVLVSVQPWHRAERPYEQLSLLFNVTALMGSVGFTVLGRRARSRMAFGPVLACSRARYDAIGGHAGPAVRAAVAEDLALGDAFGATSLHTGDRGDVEIRMYPGGLGSLVQGWTKNIATGASHVRWWFSLMVVAWIWSLAGGWLSSPWFYLATVVQLVVLGRRAGRFGLPAVLVYPVLTAFFLIVFLRSVALTALRRPVRWKGRRLAPR